MRFIRAYLYRLAFALAVGVPVAVSVSAPASAQQIVVQGSQRVDAETIRSYFGGTDQAHINQGVKDMYATGLFSDVKVRRDGGRLVVSVVENNSINRVAFEGNSKIKSDQLLPEIQTKSRGAHNPATVQADVERIKDLTAAPAVAPPPSARVPSLCRTAVSTWSSPLPKAARPAFATSFSSATRPIPVIACAT